MLNINKIERVPSLNGTNNEQLNFIFFNEENNKRNIVDFSRINQEKLTRLILKLINVIRDINHFSETISENTELIKKSLKSYKNFESLREIEENNEYIFSDTLGYTIDFSKKTESDDECLQTLIELEKLGVFND